MEVDLRTLTFERGGCEPLYSCPALIASSSVPNASWPVVYFRKPKHVTKEDFDRIIKAMRISMVVEDEK